MTLLRQAALPGFELGDYIRESVAFLREHEPPEGFFVGFSGGKDSIVTLALCRLAGVRHTAFYSCTRIDPPEVVRHIRREYPEVVWLYPRMSMWEGVRRYGPPPTSRFSPGRNGRCGKPWRLWAFPVPRCTTRGSAEWAV